MSKLKELLKELCPNGVEYKKLGEVLKIKNGKDYKIYAKGKYPVYGSGGVIAYINTYIYDKPSVLIPRKGSIDKLYYVDNPFWTVDTIFYTEINCEIIEPKFIFYCLQMQHLERLNTAGGVPSLTQNVLNKVQLPVPPLEIQREIVHILDHFTLLTTKLTDELLAEFTARRRQYEFYRSKLLFFSQDISLIPLSEIAKFTYGYTDKAQESGDVRFIRITDIDDDGCLRQTDAKYISLTDESRKYLLKEGDLLLARTGATYGKTLYVSSDEPAVYASFLIKIELDNSRILNRYYWHFSKSQEYWRQAEKYVFKGGQQQFNTSAVGRVIVPVPTLEVQKRLIDVLDNFESICSDLKIGLPAEIEARKKQYEYYRDMLLTFAAKGEIVFDDGRRTTDDGRRTTDDGRRATERN